MDYIILGITCVAMFTVVYVSVVMGYRKGYVAGSKNILAEWRHFNEKYGVEDESK